MAIGRAARTIGFRDFCQSEESQLSTWRAQFRDVYTAQAERETQDMVMLPQVRQVLERLSLQRGERVAALEAGEDA